LRPGAGVRLDPPAGERADARPGAAAPGDADGGARVNEQIRAVRAADRALRRLPAPIAGILQAEALATALRPVLDWADASPFGPLRDAPEREREETAPAT